MQGPDLALDQRSQGGRPSDASRHDDILRATLELLAEQGYDRLTVEAVVARVHAGKATVYRRWPSKAELVIDAVNSLASPALPPDTGCLTGDLRALCAMHPGDGPGEFATLVVRGLACALPHHSELFAAFQEHFVRPRTAMLRAVFERAVERGEVPPERDLDLLSSVLPALMMHRKLVWGETPDPTYMRQVIDEVLVPLALAPATPSHPVTIRGV